MPRPLQLHADRLFPSEPAVRALTRQLYEHVARLPIISPHGHTDPGWFADNAPFAGATAAAAAAGSLCPADAVQPGHFAGALGRAAGRDQRPACGLAGVRRSLLPVSRDARRGCGWTGYSARFSDCRCGSRPPPPICISTPSMSSSRCPPTARGHCLNASISKCWPPPNRRPTRCCSTRPSAPAAGKAGSSRPSGPIRSIDPEFEGFHEQLQQLGALTRRRYRQRTPDTSPRCAIVAPTSRRWARPPPIMVTPTAQTADLSAGEADGAVPARHRRDLLACGCRTVPRAHAHRHGRHGHRGRTGDAAASRIVSQPQRRNCSGAMVATGVLTFRVPPTTYARCARC